MKHSYGMSAVVDFRRLKESLMSSTDYRGMTCSCYCIMVNLMKDFVNSAVVEIDISEKLLSSNNVMEITKYVSTALSAPIDFEKGLEKLYNFYITVGYPYQSDKTHDQEGFYLALKTFDDFLRWWSESIYFTSLFTLYCEFTGVNESIVKIGTSKQSRDFLVLSLGLEPLQLYYIKKLKDVGSYWIVDKLLRAQAADEHLQ